MKSIISHMTDYVVGAGRRALRERRLKSLREDIRCVEASIEFHRAILAARLEDERRMVIEMAVES